MPRRGRVMGFRRSGPRSAIRSLGVVAVITTAVVASTAAAAAGDDVVRQAPASAGEEYVVSFDGTPEAATAAIQAAGGIVENVTEEVGVALVSSGDAAFLGNVRTRAEIRGAARNHAVGTARPGMPHRFAEE